MVNRLTHANPDGTGAPAPDASEHEELEKLSRDEMLGMLMFGASRIFKATDSAAVADEDIDAILERSKEKEEDERSARLRRIMDKRQAAAAAAAPARPEDLLADDDSAMIQEQIAALEAAKQQGLMGDAAPMDEGSDDEGEQKGGEPPAAPAAAAAPAASGAIIENAQQSVASFLFSKPEHGIREFDGVDLDKKVPGGPRKSRKAAEAERNQQLVIDDAVKRERKQRLLTVENGRRTFTILASQQHDEPLPSQKAKTPKKRGRPSKADQREREEIAAAIAAVEAAAASEKMALAAAAAAAAETPNKRVSRAAAAAASAAGTPYHSSAASASPAPAASSAAAAAAASPSPAMSSSPEPQVIGHDYALDWAKSSVHSARDLERAVTDLNAKEASGVDIEATGADGSNPHAVRLVIRRSERWNVSAEEKAAYDRRMREELKLQVALRNAKRKSWAAGAPEEEWLRSKPAGAITARSKSGQPNRGPNGEYVYTTKVRAHTQITQLSPLPRQTRHVRSANCDLMLIVFFPRLCRLILSARFRFFVLVHPRGLVPPVQAGRRSYLLRLLSAHLPLAVCGSCSRHATRCCICSDPPTSISSAAVSVVCAHSFSCVDRLIHVVVFRA